jgi:phospholipid/cholesterol/gamma-HCH transport system ATP-binding protein
MIRYRSIYKAFDTPVLRGVDLTVETGEQFALFGPSGTGKSVLLKTTLGLIIPDRGDVEIDGMSVFHGSAEALDVVRKKAGYVFQYAALFDSLNVHENVVMGLPEIELARMSKKDVARKVWDALELVNLEPREVLAKIPAELSGGMKKRVGIARAIVGRPEILLWDEPTTGLDPINTAAIERLIHRLSAELEVTSVLVTHDIEGGLEIADRVGMLEGGVLRFVGTPEEFRQCPDPVVRAFVDRQAAEAALDMMAGIR